MSVPVTIVSDEISQDLSEVRGFVRKFRLPGFELRSLSGRAFKDLTPGDVDAVRAVVGEEGWKVFGCATPVFKCEIGDAAAIREHVEIFKRSVDVARRLDCRLLRVFTFLRRPEPLDDATARTIADHLMRLADLCAPAGIRLGVENEASCIVGSGAEMLHLGRVMPDPRIGWIWDPCNVLYTPGAEGPAAAHFGEFASRILHIHVKDARRVPGGGFPEAAIVGEGDVGWAGHLAEIGRSGYRGPISLETHWRARALDPSILHLPAGHAFSAGGLEASRICMGRLRDLIGQVPDLA